MEADRAVILKRQERAWKGSKRQHYLQSASSQRSEATEKKIHRLVDITPRCYSQETFVVCSIIGLFHKLMFVSVSVYVSMVWTKAVSGVFEGEKH